MVCDSLLFAVQSRKSRAPLVCYTIITLLGAVFAVCKYLHLLYILCIERQLLIRLFYLLGVRYSCAAAYILQLRRGPFVPGEPFRNLDLVPVRSRVLADIVGQLLGVKAVLFALMLLNFGVHFLGCYGLYGAKGWLLINNLFRMCVTMAVISGSRLYFSFTSCWNKCAWAIV